MDTRPTGFMIDCPAPQTTIWLVYLEQKLRHGGGFDPARHEDGC